MQVNKGNIGKFFFTLSIVFLVYLLISPLNHVVCQIDDFFTLTVINLPISDIINITAHDVHPPLYYIVAKAVANLGAMFGIDALHSLSLLSTSAYAVLLIISATKIRNEYGWFVAGMSAFAIGVMSDFSRYYLISRMYSWAILFLLIAFLFLKNIIDNEDDKKSWIFLTLFSVLGAYTHYFAGLSAGCMYLILLAYLIRYRKGEVKNWFASVLAAILLYAPWIPSLITQLNIIHKKFWITAPTFENVIHFFGYYGFNDILLFSAFSILVLICLLIFYRMESGNLDEKDRFIILSGIGVYLGTIILGMAISEIFRPILDQRYLMPATAVLWLTIAIILSKLENKKAFLISFALICIILISGVAYTIVTHDSIYENGKMQREFLDNVTHDNNSMLILSSDNEPYYYLQYHNQTDVYILDKSMLWGESIDRLHQLFDFKTVSKEEIDGLIANNPDKNIYLISWGETEIDTPLKVMCRELNMHYYRAYPTNST